MNVDWCELTTPFGPLQLAATDIGVVGVWFGSPDDAIAALARDLGDATFTEDGPQRRARSVRRSRSICGVSATTFDLRARLAAQQRISATGLQELAAVPFGVTVSYGELARRCGSPSATPAVGSAMATNPLPVIVPCHRVVRSGGAIGGFAGARNAIDTKQWLLTHEGVLAPFATARVTVLAFDDTGGGCSPYGVAVGARVHSRPPRVGRRRRAAGGRLEGAVPRSPRIR